MTMIITNICANFSLTSAQSPRTKTEEELARDEEEALEKAERRRLERVWGEESYSEDEQKRGKRKQA
ncbi:hypothetical protein TRAPUB_8024 [Trametes pubescens]|uniref:Uncharacterized protein n=1 Tax=Trametes pubescens TaxID=154538 RepID=A0A1M2W6C9_TRAPU|nr:hypothetical protein TRAPUB_8024 [Trametes pubescens]